MSLGVPTRARQGFPSGLHLMCSYMDVCLHGKLTGKALPGGGGGELCAHCSTWMFKKALDQAICAFRLMLKLHSFVSMLYIFLQICLLFYQCSTSLSRAMWVITYTFFFYILDDRFWDSVLISVTFKALLNCSFFPYMPVNYVFVEYAPVDCK